MSIITYISWRIRFFQLNAVNILSSTWIFEPTYLFFGWNIRARQVIQSGKLKGISSCMREVGNHSSLHSLILTPGIVVLSCYCKRLLKNQAGKELKTDFEHVKQDRQKFRVFVITAKQIPIKQKEEKMNTNRT
jgi:hypothetical protein